MNQNNSARCLNELIEMERMLINASQRDEKRVAIVTENVLFDFITERPGFEQKIGNIYLAKITSIEPSLDAIFVEFGSERHGFLPLKEVSRQYFNPKAEQSQNRPGIRDLLRVGQELMVQVEKEERGNKGAALTTYISLAGSYLVLMPNSPRAGGISRRIEGDERDQLREILNQVSVPEGMGLIVRTAAIGRTNEELKWDLDVLLAHWKNIEEAAKSRHAPFLIHQEGNVVIRAIRDYVRQDTTEIIIDDETEFQNAKHYLEQIRPDVADRVKLYNDPTPLFIRYGIEHQIETAYKRTIDLPSGASIVIDYTEALVSIDINSARATKGSNIEATAFNTNIEAAEEIARQLRLRDIGGLIVIDFIDMLEPNNQIEVEKHLSKCLKNDRARIQIQRISRFGLLEMSRQRLRPSLRDSHQHVCPTCSGHGSIRSVDSVALTLVRIIEEEALKPHTAEIIIQASTEAATYLLNEKRHLLASIEKNHGVKVSVIPNPNLQSSNYLKKRIRTTDTEETGLSSSERLQEPTVDINLPSASDRPTAHQPAVKQMIPTRPEKVAAGGGLIKRLLSSMFGQQDDDEGSSKTASGSAESSFQSKPSYTPQRPSPSRQRTQRRPARNEEGYEGQETRERSSDSRERTGSRRRHGEGSRSGDRSEPRSGESRQRSGGMKRGTARNAPSSSGKPSTSKSSQYSDNYQDPYKEYSQTAPAPTTSSTPQSGTIQEPLPKPTVLNTMADEAPITIKASKSPTTPSSSEPTATKPGTPARAPSTTTFAPSTSSSTRSFTSYGPSTSSQRPAAPSANQPVTATAQKPETVSSSANPPASATVSKPETVSSTSATQPSSSTGTTSPITQPPSSAVPTSPLTKPISSTGATASVSESAPSTDSTATVSASAQGTRSTTSSSAPFSQSAASATSVAPIQQTTPTAASTPATTQTVSSTGSTSSPSTASQVLPQEDQKPLIIRATTEEKPSTTQPSSPSTEKKDKESTDI